ncbi:protein-glutamate methylesterase/protein-glutamine glutaminase [Aliiroseovarius marinus]|uniref:protein-glutamate methylesterase/protein-glutamine glutaminase n=1 Tax=Aliiroseovarius marinus TaxID=2500159 RepID=UPI003D7D4690
MSQPHASQKKIDVLIVDDSATMRALVRHALEEAPDIRVVGEAADAFQAREEIKKRSPDVLTLDVDMPGMNGLDFLQRLMKHRPMPVVMLSALTAKDSATAMKALSLGAIDCIEKPRVGRQSNTFRNLSQSLRVAARANLRAAMPKKPNLTQAAPRVRMDGLRDIVLIGASTGGLEAIGTVLSSMPERCPPVLITQHMPKNFLTQFAEHLDRRVPAKVRVAMEGDQILPGRILLAPGGAHHLVVSPDDPTRLHLKEGPTRSGHRPSVDEMMLSAQHLAKRSIAVLLTGMGSDGARGMAALKSKGALCIGQDAESCVVYGMPKVAAEIGGVSEQLPLSEIGPRIMAEARVPESTRVIQ